MSGFVNVLVFCDHRDSFSVELDYLKKRFVDDSGSTKIIALCDYFSDHLISKHELLSDIFLTFLDLISAHNIIAFFVSQFTFEPCKCLPNKHPELDSFITKSSFEPDIPQHSHCTTESPFTCCTLMELLPFFDYERLLGTLRFKKMLYFFKKPSVNFKGSLSRQDILRSLLSGNGLDVYDYEDYKFTGFVLENELLKLKQTSHLRPLSCEGKENHGPKSEFILPRHIKKLEDILDRFCLSASKDENDSIPSVNNILDLYVLEDWSCKLKRSDQRLRNISTKFQHDSSRNRILLISGQPGVGKTRFLTSWLNKRKSDGFTFMNDHIKVKELTTITDADETTNNSLKTESDIIFIDEFIEPGKCNSDIWQLLDDLNRKARTARYKSSELNSSLATLLSSLTSGQEDFERARQLRQLGSRLFTSLSPTNSNDGRSDLPVIVIIDGLEYLEDPLAETAEAVKCIDWLFSCHAHTKETDMNEYGGINSGGLPIIPSRTRFILTCSSSHYINHQLTKCPLVNVIEYSSVLGLKENMLMKISPTSIGNLEETNEVLKENNPVTNQLYDLISLFFPLLNNDTLNHGKETEVNQEFNLHSLFKYRVQIVKDRLRNPIINKLHKYWCLKENALAQKIFIHELYITSFGFDANNNHKNIFNWDDYIERLLATQSIRQLLLCLLQQWAIEFEYNIITKEKELSLRNSMENSEGHSTLSTFNDDKQASDHKINFKALLQTSTTQLSKDWTVGLVGLVFHTLVAAFRFTWTNEKMYQEDENSGFKFQDVLHVLKNINLPKYYVIRSILPSTVMALHSPLLGYYCLRILHRAGAFSQTTEGGVLHQTNLDGYLKFNHEIIYSVVRQLLARDNGATGIHLPFITTALKWSTGGEQGNTLSNILSHRHLQTVSKASNQSLSNYSLSLIEKNLYKSKPKITFKKTGRIIQAALSLTQSGDTFSINNQFTNEKKSLNKINDNDTVVIPISIKRSSSLRASLQLVPDIYRIALKSNDLLDNNDVNYSTSQLSSDNCAYTRHILLLTEIMNYLVIKPNYPVTYGFLTRLVITQIEMICIVNNLNGVKIILNNLEFILLHPCFLLCLAFPTYATEVFTGSIQNSHLLVALWQTIQNSFMLIDKYHENDKNNDKTSLFENDVRSSIGKLNCSHENSFNIANASYNFSGDNTTMKRSITKLNELAQRVLDHVESKKYTKENCSDSPNICNSFSQLNDLSGENNLESLVWIIGELIYYLGDELVSVQILSKLAVCFINRETLCKSDILQLSHLGLNIMNKLRYLRNEVNESIDNQLMLYQSIVYETEMTITEWLKESFILTLCDTEENRLTERRIFTALAYIKMYRLESVIGLTESSNEQLNLFEYQICQTIRDIKQFNSQLIDRTLLAIGMYLLAKIRLLQMNTSEHEFLMFQAISECMADQGEYHPLIAEWLIILALSLQKPPNGDNNELDEVNFLRMKFGRTRAQECLRWSLDIMTYNQEILIRPVIPPPTSVLSNFNQHIYKKLHRSILLRLPRYLIIPQIQPSLLSPFLSESSRSTSYNLNSSTGRKVSNPSSNRTDITLNFNNQHLFSNPYVYQTLPAEICLQLVICLLKDKRQISLQEAITRAAFVLHERILFLGVDHPATIQISKILDHIEHYLIHGWTSNETRDKEVKLTKSKLLNDRKSGYLFSTNRPHDELFGRNQSTQHTRLSSRNSLFDEQMSKDHVSTRATSRAEQLPSKRLDRKQLKISNTFKISKYESNLKYLGKIHYFLSKKINQTSNTRKYTN
ncbi:unnamed protein product [Schistosoma rodhaini]|nr:unnamed protein product [Schistosoma rodhaini]